MVVQRGLPSHETYDMIPRKLFFQPCYARCGVVETAPLIPYKKKIDSFPEDFNLSCYLALFTKCRRTVFFSNAVRRSPCSFCIIWSLNLVVPRTRAKAFFLLYA